ncbi:MAG: hypothetical protein PHS34_08670 [Candidatus Omnitrophica bacterium]|nr:hypothetical protein [Candidatus Omnitrophota bacterium]
MPEVQVEYNHINFLCPFVEDCAGPLYKNPTLHGYCQKREDWEECETYMKKVGKEKRYYLDRN